MLQLPPLVPRLVREPPGWAASADGRRLRRPQPPVELEGEEQVGQLGLEVGLPPVVGAAFPQQVAQVHMAEAGDHARHRHHPGAGRRREERQQPGRQGEVAEVVHAHVGLEPVGRQAPVDGHQPGVVAQHVEAAARRPARRRTSRPTPGWPGRAAGPRGRRPGARARRAAAAASPAASSRQAMITRAPRPARYRVTSRPRPRLAPVTTATRPDRSGMSRSDQPHAITSRPSQVSSCPTAKSSGHRDRDRDIWEEFPGPVSKSSPVALGWRARARVPHPRGPGTGGAVCRGWSTGRWPPAWP